MKLLIFRIKTYLEYRRRAVNQYGLHSPFLYDLYLVCFRPSFKHNFPSISKLRKRLVSDKTRIEVKDFGAGSLVSKSNNRSVNKMYKSAAISRKQGELLYRLVTYLQPKNILELGTHLGLSSLYMCLSGAEVISLEGCPRTGGLASQNHEALGADNIQVRIGNFQEILPKTLIELDRIDFSYIDGNHSYEGTIWNYQQILAKTTEESVLVFDDINWSPDMKKAWDEIISRPEISLSVNCYKFGIVFFRKGVEKQNFYFKF